MNPPPQFWKSNSAPCLRSSQGCCQVHEGFRGRKKLFFEIFFFFRLHILRFLLLILLLRIYYLPLKTGYRLTKRPRQRGGKFISGATKAHLLPPPRLPYPFIKKGGWGGGLFLLIFKKKLMEEGVKFPFRLINDHLQNYFQLNYLIFMNLLYNGQCIYVRCTWTFSKYLRCKSRGVYFSRTTANKSFQGTLNFTPPPFPLT